MADLREAHRLGVASDGLLQEIADRASASAARAEAMRKNAAPVQRHSIKLAELQMLVSMARRDSEIAREEGDASKATRAQKMLSSFEQQIERTKEALEVAKRAGPAVAVPGKSNPPEVADSLALIRELQRAERNLRATATSVYVSPRTAIGELDAQLCLVWGNEPSRRGAPRTAISRLLAWKPSEAGRLLSARNAEKAAMRYYENLGLSTEDVSVSQLSSGADSWKDFDIRTGDRRIDVKNARESLHGEGGYVEHSVAKFKLARENGSRVTIAATVSPYLRGVDQYFERPQQATILGELDAEQLRAVLAWAGARFGGRLQVVDPVRASFLPGWLFEFPDAHYPQRRDAIQAAPDLLRRLLDALAYTCEIPGWLWIFSDEPVPESLPSAALVKELRVLRDSVGISRRSLFVLALGLALEDVGAPQMSGAAAGTDTGGQLELLDRLCRLFFVKESDRLNAGPLGLCDPLGYVRSIIATLSGVVSTLRSRRIDVVSFRLPHPAILQGVLRDGGKMTLLAYCGGWQRAPIVARCGMSPLSLARHATCPSCSHLICGNCGHCSDFCEACDARQAQVAEEATTHPSKGHARGDQDGEWDFAFDWPP